MGLPWIVSLKMESGFYIQSSDGVWSLILMDIILSETGLYLPWRVPHLTCSKREPVQVNDQIILLEVRIYKCRKINIAIVSAATRVPTFDGSRVNRYP